MRLEKPIHILVLSILFLNEGVPPSAGILPATNAHNPEVVELFLEEGTDPSLEDKDNGTAIDYAKDNEELDAEGLFEEVK